MSKLFMQHASYSRLTTYENCPKQVHYKYIEKIPEPDRGEVDLEVYPTGEFPNDRGSRVHEECEEYILGNGPMPDEAALHFSAEMTALRSLYEQGNVSPEGEYCVDENWNFVDKDDPNRWLIVILDLVMVRGDTAYIIDFKTGRRAFNEVKHAQQLMLYSIVTALRHPEVKWINSELWYFDQNETVKKKYKTKQVLRFLPGFDERLKKMCTDEEMLAKPSANACRFCPYGPSNWAGNALGICKVGVPYKGKRKRKVKKK